MTREEMIAYLDKQLTEIDARINEMCAKIAAAPIERTVERNMQLAHLCEAAKHRGGLIEDLGDLKFNRKGPEDLPLYELFGQAEE